LAKVGDDNNYLKSTLWPMLEALYVAKRVTEFQSWTAAVVEKKATKGPEFTKKSESDDSLESVEGEGTCEPRGSTPLMSPHLLFIFNSHLFLCVFAEERRDERDEGDKGDEVEGNSGGVEEA